MSAVTIAVARVSGAIANGSGATEAQRYADGDLARR
jgi:hypothetical protein